MKTGEVYKSEEEWKTKGISETEIRRDVKVIMPSLDLLGKTKQCEKMSITRSQIARQLLAEGGAPRKGFQRGGVNEADVEAGLATQTMADLLHLKVDIKILI